MKSVEEKEDLSHSDVPIRQLQGVLTFTGVNCQELTPVNNEENSLEGSTVTLSYNYSKQADYNDYFFWYRQYPGKPPEFLMYISGSNITKTADSLKSEKRFFTDMSEEKRGVKLQISSAAVSDSAVYYCALQPTASFGTEEILCSFYCSFTTSQIMLLHFIWMMMLTFHTGSSEDLLKPFKDVMLALEGDNVTLSCNYSGSVQILYWYQQKSSSSPQLLIMEHSKKEGLSLKHDKETKIFHLQISSAAVSDSAVYYCALQ
ncbi:uncharacterized protein, partial [Thunnus thynnus]|uniref:uncharacterized protein n=1 Tax=Thunnus thynnus TaxID=8237 RepID=UPI003529BCC5